MILQVAMLGTFAVPIWDGRAEVGKTEGRCVSSTSMFHCLVVFAPRGTEDITWFCFALLGHHLLQYAEAIGSLIGKSYGNPEIKMPTTGNSAHSVEDHKGEIPHKDVYSMCHRGIVNEEGGIFFDVFHSPGPCREVQMQSSAECRGWCRRRLLPKVGVKGNLQAGNRKKSVQLRQFRIQRNLSSLIPFT